MQQLWWTSAVLGVKVTMPIFRRGAGCKTTMRAMLARVWCRRAHHHKRYLSLPGPHAWSDSRTSTLCKTKGRPLAGTTKWATSAECRPKVDACCSTTAASPRLPTPARAFRQPASSQTQQSRNPARRASQWAVVTLWITQHGKPLGWLSRAWPRSQQGCDCSLTSTVPARGPRQQREDHPGLQPRWLPGADRRSAVQRALGQHHLAAAIHSRQQRSTRLVFFPAEVARMPGVHRTLGLGEHRAVAGGAGGAA